MPSTNAAFAEYCRELLSCIGPCRTRRMFGGYGISLDGLTLAIVTDLGTGDRLWLKADEATRASFEAAGCARFTYGTSAGERSMNYYAAPDEAMESPQLMAPWARQALDCALKARAAKAERPGSKSTSTPPSPKPRRATAPPAKPSAKRKSTKG